jgi:DNA-binding transcriptional LysR family regulator
MWRDAHVDAEFVSGQAREIQLSLEVPMNLRFLETFVWAARLETFALVADKLHISQASVSARIGTLEEELGVKLFRREGKINILSEHGERALVAAERLLRYAAEFNEQVTDKGTLRGTIRIGMSDAAAFILLSPIVKQIRAVYPKVNLELYTGQSSDLIKDLFDGRLHLIVAMGINSADHVVSRPLIKLPVSWVASRSVTITSEISDFDELGDVQVISFWKGSIPFELFRGQLGSHAFSQVKICWCDSLETILRLVRDGLGIAILPEAIIAGDLKDGSLRRLKLLPVLDPFEFHVAYLDTSDSSLRGELADLLRAIAADFSEGIGHQFASPLQKKNL